MNNLDNLYVSCSIFALNALHCLLLAAEKCNILRSTYLKRGRWWVRWRDTGDCTSCWWCSLAWTDNISSNTARCFNCVSVFSLLFYQTLLTLLDDFMAHDNWKLTNRLFLTRTCSPLLLLLCTSYLYRRPQRSSLSYLRLQELHCAAHESLKGQWRD